MKILLVSEFSYPSGYRTLAEALAFGLVAKGHEVVVLGKDDNGLEHDYPFAVHPTQVEFVPQHMARLAGIVQPDWVALLMDVPKQVSVLNNLFVVDPAFYSKYKIASLFPVESDPFSDKWRFTLQLRTTIRFVFTEFGKKTCEAAGLRVHKLPIGLSSTCYAPAQQTNMDKPYILTVAANQPRKNLPGAMEIAAKAIKNRRDAGLDLSFILITDPDSKDGWDLRQTVREMNKAYGVGDAITVIDRSGVSPQALRIFYANAAVLLLTSIAEGIGLPIYEAQAQGCPVVATNCCAIPEAVKEGALIDVEAVTPYAWGNTRHYWPSIEDGTKKVLAAIALPHKPVMYGLTTTMAQYFISILSAFDSAVENVKQEQTQEQTTGSVATSA